MPIPDYQSLMLPLLNQIRDGKTHKMRELYAPIAAQIGLTEQEQNELLPSGKQSVFACRVGWARTYLGKAKLLSSPSRGQIMITLRGEDALAQNPNRIDNEFLRQYPEFIQFKDASRPQKDQLTNTHNNGDDDNETPTDMIEKAYAKFRQTLIDDLLQTIQDCSPAFFEKLIVDLMLALGYGGSQKDAGSVVGKSGDEGIDGIIKEDQLGLDMIYLQAKKWANVVGRPEIQKFVGALQGKRAKKGVFITSSHFSSEAHDYVEHLDCKVILIDGIKLAELMMDHNVGVSKADEYVIKKIDSDYFTEE